MKIFIISILFLFLIESTSYAFKYDNCEEFPWRESRMMSKSELLSVLEKMNRNQIKSVAFFEMNHKSDKSMAFPLTLYLANTEMDKRERGFWKTMAYVLTQGENPEEFYKLWPTKRGRNLMPLSSTEICKYYNASKRKK